MHRVPRILALTALFCVLASPFCRAAPVARDEPSWPIASIFWSFLEHSLGIGRESQEKDGSLMDPNGFRSTGPAGHLMPEAGGQTLGDDGSLMDPDG